MNKYKFVAIAGLAVLSAVGLGYLGKYRASSETQTASVLRVDKFQNETLSKDAGVYSNNSATISASTSPVSPVRTSTRVYLLGGATQATSSGNVNDVWMTNDLINWSNISPDTSNATKWSGRTLYGFGSGVYFKNKLWVMGGAPKNSNSLANDVWSSPDGVTWTQVTANAPWGGRVVEPVVFNNKIWVIGGLMDGYMANDVWSSPDGVTWTQVTANAPWGGRGMTNPVVFKNKLWVMGGWTNSPQGTSVATNDVWSSPDGVTWTQVNANAPWSARSAHSSLVFNNKMWILGGVDTTQPRDLNDVWYSSDGVNWTPVVPAPWAGRRGHTALVFSNKMYVLGASDNGQGNDVWSSPDGVTWTQVTANAPWPKRSWHQVIVAPQLTIKDKINSIFKN